MNILYKAIKTKDKNGRECFGVEMSKQYFDVFEDEIEANRFVELCNNCTLSETHFEDAVNDYVNNKNDPWNRIDQRP